jgi:hypothetical protein
MTLWHLAESLPIVAPALILAVLAGFVLGASLRDRSEHERGRADGIAEERERQRSRDLDDIDAVAAMWAAEARDGGDL